MAKRLTLMRVGPDANKNEKGIIKVFDGDSVPQFGEVMRGVFPSIEYYETLTSSSLRVGTYDMFHDLLTGDLHGHVFKVPKPCLRPVEDRIRHILIHGVQNDDPKYLEGCIAPGLSFAVDLAYWFATDYTVFSQSELAMNKIFELLGGFKQGNRVTLQVLTNATGINEDRDHWRRFK